VAFNRAIPYFISYMFRRIIIHLVWFIYVCNRLMIEEANLQETIFAIVLVGFSLGYLVSWILYVISIFVIPEKEKY